MMKRYAMFGLCMFLGFFIAKGDWVMAFLTVVNLVLAEMES